MENFFDRSLLPSYPLSNSSSCIVFKAPLSDQFTNLDQSLLEVTVKMKNADNSDLAAFVAPAAAVQGGNPPAVVGNSVGFSNLALYAIFSGLDIKLNGISTSSIFFTQGYVSYLQLILSYSTGALNSKLALSGSETDKDFTADGAHTGAPASGFMTRASYTARSREWKLLGNLHSPITLQNRYILPLCSISITLH